MFPSTSKMETVSLKVEIISRQLWRLNIVWVCCLQAQSFEFNWSICFEAMWKSYNRSCNTKNFNIAHNIHLIIIFSI